MRSKHVYLLAWLAAVAILAIVPAGGVAKFALPVVYFALPLALVALLVTTVVESVRSRDWGRPGLLFAVVGVVVLAMFAVQRLG